MEFMLCLPYILLLCLCLKSSVSEAHVQVSTWSAHVPGTITALQGSCVVIPCTFTYPGQERQQSDLTGIWHTKDHGFIYHPDIGEVLYRFRGRTSLVGDLGKKNCSLRIDRVQRTDGGPFIFRLAIDDGERFSYTKSEVSIVVKDRPDVPLLTLGKPVKVGETVSASCSVYHSCPSNPPLLSWNHIGTHSVHSEKLPGGHWRIVSVLLFTSSVSDHKKPLTCTTNYWEGKIARSSKALNIKYAPIHVRIDFESTVKEGDSVELQCSSDSNPTAHSYQWYSATRELQSERDTFTLHNVSRHTGAYYCTAINTEGQGSSNPVQINVEYPPEIKAGSTCMVNSSGVTCHCIVDSVPSSEVKWLLSEGYLLSSWTETDGSVTLYTLHTTRGLFHTTSCQASNSHGIVTMAFVLPKRDKLLYITVTISVLLGIGVAVLLWAVTRNRNSSETPVTKKPHVDTAPKDSSSCSASARKETILSTGVYSECAVNQHVYGNIGVGEDSRVHTHVIYDEATYENM